MSEHLDALRMGTRLFLFIYSIFLLSLQLSNDSVAASSDIESSRNANSLTLSNNTTSENHPPILPHSRPTMAEPMSEPLNPPRTVKPVTRTNLSSAIYSAYAALRAGDIKSAENQYTALLKLNPKNKDILYGIASASAHQNKHQVAAEYYFQISTLFPNEHKAQVALSAILRELAPRETHLHLSELVEKNPDSAELIAMLGHSFSQHKDWQNAQEQYFRAGALNPDNPDFAFNLAVSLDQLGKKNAALAYYQRSLKLINHATVPGFDPTTVKNRIAILVPRGQP